MNDIDVTTTIDDPHTLQWIEETLTHFLSVKALIGMQPYRVEKSAGKWFFQAELEEDAHSRYVRVSIYPFGHHNDLLARGDIRWVWKDQKISKLLARGPALMVVLEEAIAALRVSHDARTELLQRAQYDEDD